jgi:hypothetical protein
MARILSIDVICKGSDVSDNSPKGAIGILPPFIVAHDSFLHVAFYVLS